MDCDTTGIEPDFALVKFKKLAGGGYFKIINRSVPEALAHAGLEQSQIDAIVELRGRPRHAGRLHRRHHHEALTAAASTRKSSTRSKAPSKRPSTSASSSTSGRWARPSAETLKIEAAQLDRRTSTC